MKAPVERIWTGGPDSYVYYQALWDNGTLSGDFTLIAQLGFNTKAYPLDSPNKLSHDNSPISRNFSFGIMQDSKNFLAARAYRAGISRNGIYKAVNNRHEFIYNERFGQGSGGQGVSFDVNDLTEWKISRSGDVITVWVDGRVQFQGRDTTSTAGINSGWAFAATRGPVGIAVDNVVLSSTVEPPPTWEGPESELKTDFMFTLEEGAGHLIASEESYWGFAEGGSDNTPGSVFGWWAEDGAATGNRSYAANTGQLSVYDVVLSPQATLEGWFKFRRTNASGYGNYPSVPVFFLMMDGRHSHPDFTSCLRGGLVIEQDGAAARLNIHFEDAGHIIEPTSNVVPMDEWVHLAWVRDGPAHTLYLNGEEVAYGEDQLHGSTPLTRAQLTVGNNADHDWAAVFDTEPYFYVDQIRLTSMALDPQLFLDGTGPGSSVAMVRNLDFQSGDPYANLANSQLDKVLSFETSPNGGLATGDTIAIFLNLPPGFGVPFPEGAVPPESVLVAVGDGAFVSCAWSYLSGDTLILGAPANISPMMDVRVMIRSFLNPDVQGYYDYGVRTQADGIMVQKQMYVGNFPYPLAFTGQELQYDHGNWNGEPDAGERMGYNLYFEHTGMETFDLYAKADDSYDPYVNSPAARGDFGWWLSQYTVNPGETHFFNIWFRIDSHAPAGHELKIPVMLYRQDTDELVGVDTLRLTIVGGDNFPPDIWMESPGFVPVGEPVLLKMDIQDGGEIATAGVEVRNMQDGQSYGSVTLYDDGTNGDENADDGRFSGFFTPPAEADYWMDAFAEDEFGNFSQVQERFRFTTRPFEATSSLLLVNENNPWSWWDVERYLEALDDLGYTYDHWDGYVRNSGWDKSLPDSSIIAQYADGAVIYVGITGWDASENAKLRYMKDLNISFWAGGDNQFAHRVWWGDNDFENVLADYFGTAYVQDYVGHRGVFGVPGDPVADGLSLDLDWDGWDELDPAGTGVTSMTYGDFPYLAAAGAAGTGRADSLRVRLQRQRMLRTLMLSSVVTPAEKLEAVFKAECGITKGGSATKTKVVSEAELAGVISSGSAAIRNDPGGYRSFIQGFSLGNIPDYNDRLDYAERVISWLAAPADTFLLSAGWADVNTGLGTPVGFTFTGRDSIFAFEAKVLVDPARAVYVPGTGWINPELWPGAQAGISFLADTLLISISHWNDRFVKKTLVEELFSLEFMAAPGFPGETAEIQLIEASVNTSAGPRQITRLNNGSLNLRHAFLYSLGNSLAKPGDTTHVTVRLYNEVPVAGLELQVSYDSTLAQLVGVSSPLEVDSLYEIYIHTPGQRRYHLVFAQDIEAFNYQPVVDLGFDVLGTGIGDTAYITLPAVEAVVRRPDGVIDQVPLPGETGADTGYIYNLDLPTVTADLFDDFEDGDYAGWTVDSVDNWEVAGGVLQMKGPVTRAWSLEGGTERHVRYRALWDNGTISGDFTLAAEIGFNPDAYYYLSATELDVTGWPSEEQLSPYYRNFALGIMQDEKNFLLARARRERGQRNGIFKLVNNIAGAYSQIYNERFGSGRGSQGVSFDVHDLTEWKISRSGDVITVWIDGRVQFQGRDTTSSAGITSGWAFVSTYGPVGLAVDNVALSSTAGPPPTWDGPESELKADFVFTLEEGAGHLISSEEGYWGFAEGGSDNTPGSLFGWWAEDGAAEGNKSYAVLNSPSRAGSGLREPMLEANSSFRQETMFLSFI